jgi:hypothetical protein
LIVDGIARKLKVALWSDEIRVLAGDKNKSITYSHLQATIIPREEDDDRCMSQPEIGGD